MTYDIPESLTLVKKRTQIVAPFDEESFEDIKGTEVLRCSWNTGEYMVSSKKSFLTVTISVKSGNATSFTFGTGSVSSIFRDIIIRSKSGVELCRMNDPKIWNKIKFYYDTDIQNSEHVKDMSGFPSTSSAGTTYETAEPPEFRKYEFGIRLDYLAPMFSSIDGSEYLPSQLAEGLTFELYTAPLNTIFQTSGNPGEIATQYNIHNIKFRLDGVILNDRSLMELQNKCHKKGLEWVCHGVYKQDIKNYNEDLDVQNQINYSVSQALRADTVYQFATRNLFTNDKCQFITSSRDFQYRSGSDYFPMNRVKENSFKPMETYLQAIYTHPLTNVSIDDYLSGTNTIYSANLNLNDDLSLSGIIVNNSKTLEYNATGISGSQQFVDVTTLLHYVKVIKIVGMNVSVAT